MSILTKPNSINLTFLNFFKKYLLKIIKRATAPVLTIRSGLLLEYLRGLMERVNPELNLVY